MTEDVASNEPIVTRNVRLLLIAGCIVIALAALGHYWSFVSHPAQPSVSTAPELSLAEAKKAVWFSLPEMDASGTGLAFRNAHVVGKDWVSLHYEMDAQGWVEIGKGIKRPARGKLPLPQTARKTTLVNGHLAIFIQGDFDEAGNWQDNADYKTLEWNANGFNYRIEQRGLQWDYKQMVQFGEALIVKPNKQDKPVS